MIHCAKKFQFVSLFTTYLLILSTTPLMSQSRAAEHAVVVVPDSSIQRPEDVGQRAHTNHLLLVSPAFTGTSPSGETPQSIYPVYALTFTGSGGSNTIAIVDAFEYPTAENDLNVFSNRFGLPACTTANGCFKKVYAAGSQPRPNCGWAQEAALDIEWAHAMAPDAKIVLVEAASNSFADLFTAVDVASGQAGVSEVSMSWGGSEFSSEANYDFHMGTAGRVYFASSGDTGGATIYPGVSPNVVSAGGTSIHRDSSGNFVSETGWSGSGGGPSKYELKPAYQKGIANTDSTHRSVPDFSFDSDPNTGVSVYDSTRCQGSSGWLVFGGTSVASPSLAGVVNLAASSSGGAFAAGSQAELTTIYSNLTNTADFRDIVSGAAGSFSAVTGWDFVTGVGSNQGLSGK